MKYSMNKKFAGKYKQMFTKSSADVVLEDCLQSHTIPEQEGKLQPFTETGLSEKNQLRSLTM